MHLCLLVFLEVDHVSERSTNDAPVLCDPTSAFYPVFIPSCVAKDTRSGGRFQVRIERYCTCPQQASSSTAPGTRRCGLKQTSGQLSIGKFRSMIKLAEPSLCNLRQHICKMEAAPQFHRWHTISVPHVKQPSFPRLLVMAVPSNPSAESNAPQLDRPCPFCS